MIAGVGNVLPTEPIHLAGVFSNGLLQTCAGSRIILILRVLLSLKVILLPHCANSIFSLNKHFIHSVIVSFYYLQFAHLFTNQYVLFCWINIWKLNVDPDNGLSVLPSQIWGLYIGWAKFDGQKVFKAVISIVWNLGCCGSERTIVSILL